jgi:hypothetical protein
VTTHSVADAKKRLPELIDRALEGEESSSRVMAGQWLSSRPSRDTLSR